MAANRKLFHRAHYNIIAAQIRENFANHMDDLSTNKLERVRNLMARGVLADFAVDLAKRFQEDNHQFDPRRFLAACTPDATFYPLEELWEEE